MAVGRISTAVLTDIGNAIREQNGTSASYKPREMAGAVAALDGARSGEGSVLAAPDRESGVVSSKVFDALGDAIRGQNGLDVRYKPGEMADAIRALTWTREPVLRCLWLGDGNMEFNFLESVRSATGVAVVESFEVDMAGYGSMSARPWEHLKGLVEHVVIDPSVADAGVRNCSYWFAAFSKLHDVTGFECLNGVTDFNYVFASCSQLRSVFATSFSNSTIVRSSSPFQGCTRLVGGADCTACNGNGGASNARITAGGFFTDPTSDKRTWLYAALFDDGTVEIDATMPDSSGRTLVECGDFCANTRYACVQCTPWAPYVKQVKKASILSGTSAVDGVNTCYWFYGCTLMTEVEGLANLRKTSYMNYCFNSCTSLATLNLCGFDPASLRSLGYAFAGCSSLECIYVLSSWVLPAACAGIGTFYGDVKLVGGNGTAYSADNYHAQRCVVDKDGQPGYLTGI